MCSIYLQFCCNFYTICNMDYQKFEDMLRDGGFSITASRKKVFSALTHATEPIYVRELVDLCPDIDRVSVYRTIALFEKVGIANRLQIGWKYKLELNSMFHNHHHHLTCTSCGTIIEFREPYKLDALLSQIATTNHFDARQHTLEIRGLCRDCR